MHVEEADAEVSVQRVKAEGEKPVFDGEAAAVPAAEAKLLDASTLQPDKSLSGRDLEPGTIQGGFSGRNFDGGDNSGGAPPKVGVSLCGSGHALEVITAWCAGGSCDVCQRGIAEGEDIWVCGPCDRRWWACTECRAQDLVLGERSIFHGEDTAFKKAKLLDASMLQPGESLAKRDLQGWTLQGDFSGRNFDGTNLQRAFARCANFRNASMRNVDASRADFRGASLAGVAVHGATFRRTNCEDARMAGMWGGPYAQTRPEVKADKDGTMPPVEPLEATGEEAVRWAKQEAPPVDTAKDGEEDAQDETAWAAHKQEMRGRHGWSEEQVATSVNMQRMDAR